MGKSHLEEVSTLIASARAAVARAEDVERSTKPRSARAGRSGRTTGAPATSEDLVRAAETAVRSLRSALDLTAAMILALHGRTDPRGHAEPVVFPIVGFDDPPQSWPRILEHALPGVNASCPEVARVLARHQLGSAAENTWLPMLKKLSDATRSRPLRNVEELERLLSGAPIVPSLQRMVTRSIQLVRELRGAALPLS